MTPVILPLPLAAPAMAAAAQNAPKGFPLDKVLCGDFTRRLRLQGKGLGLTVSRDPKGGRRGSGNASCNGWSDAIVLHDDQIEFHESRHHQRVVLQATDDRRSAFTTSAKRWHGDVDKLIIEGDTARLMLKPGVADLKAVKKKHK